MMAKLIKTDEPMVEIVPENGTDFQLEQLYKAIGCNLIEVVYLPDGNIMIADEEGLLVEKPLNALATTIAGHPIVGDVVVCASDQLR